MPYTEAGNRVMNAVKCPKCKAPAGKNCRTPSGGYTLLHGVRWVAEAVSDPQPGSPIPRTHMMAAEDWCILCVLTAVTYPTSYTQIRSEGVVEAMQTIHYRPSEILAWLDGQMTKDPDTTFTLNGMNGAYIAVAEFMGTRMCDGHLMNEFQLQGQRQRRP